MYPDPALPTGLLVGCCDDDPDVIELLENALSYASHRTVITRTGAEAAARFAHDQDLDVVVLGVGLPDIDGRDVCRVLRANGQRAPVMFLSDFGGPHEIVKGFAAGGLAYLVKPFAVPELVARIESLARRKSAPRLQERTAVWIDPARHALVLGDRVRSLTPTELRIAAVLLANQGQLVSRSNLVNSGWVPGAQVNPNTIDTYLFRIRRHLRALDSGASIETVRGDGYVLTHPADQHD